MPLKQNIKDEVAKLLAVGDYTIQDSTTIPGPGDNRLTFGNTGVRFDAVTLYIDMRGSTAVINEHRPQSAAKIHKAYLFLATKLIAEHGGQIRSYNGDSILAFFPGKSSASVTSAIKAAMQIKFMLTQECAAEFKRYREVDFGIGIDIGPVLCVKAGMGKNENHNDLLWLGNPVNRATVLSDMGKGPRHIAVSQAVRDLQADEVKKGGNPKVDMWTSQSYVYNGESQTAWTTTYYWNVA